MPLNGSVTKWTSNEVKEWLIKNGFNNYSHLLCDVHKINGTSLLMLTEEDLKNPPLKIEVLGDVKILSLLINNLRIRCNKEFGSSDLPISISYTNGLKTMNSCSKNKKGSHASHNKIMNRESIREGSPDLSELNFQSEEINFFTSPADGNPKSHGMATHLEAEYWKTFLSFSYFVCVTIITCMVMVIVHDRVPDMKKYPPLPDIFLDNFPLIPWAFGMCEITGSMLMLTWIGVLVCHKHRFILMRRFFALMGTVFLLRCFTMLITSLSVPGSHLECAPRPYGDIWAKFSKALEIWQGFGMSVRGVRTCGDYMFSGHTVTLTMLNFFITEYTPRRVYFLHTFTWILNLFGIFFILAAREHYSIDVFVAFYITSRIFLYYHTLANSRALKQRDRYRAKIWFPLFSFFEARIDGVVPNEYQKPWRLLSMANLHKLTRRIIYLAKEKLKISDKSANNKKSKKRT